MDLKDLQAVIKYVSKLEVNEVAIELKDVKLKIKNRGSEASIVQTVAAPPAIAPAPVASAAPAQTTPIESPGTSVESDQYITVKSPMIGTVYHKPSPDKPNFVNIGDTVSIGDILCTIEAMKLFNEIESDVSGKIVKILVEDAAPVEFGQPLFLIDPS